MDEESYRRALAEVERLIATGDNDEHLKRLAAEVEEFEKEHYPIPAPTAEEAEAFRREQEGSLMGFWRITSEQRRAIGRCVEGRLVHDLGAGDGSFSVELVKLGAREVVAVEKDWPAEYELHDPRIRVKRTWFSHIDEPMEVGLISWPTNRQRDPDLVRLLERCKLVIYLGSNVDSTSCGSQDMFVHFTCRQLLEYLPDRRNTLLVLGPMAQEGDDIPVRLATGEELAGMIQWIGGPPLTYEDTIAMCPHIDAAKRCA